MSDPEQEKLFEEKLIRWNKTFKERAEKMGISEEHLMMLQFQNELVQLNIRLADIQFHLHNIDPTLKNEG